MMELIKFSQPYWITLFLLFVFGIVKADNDTRICRASWTRDYLLTRQEFRSYACSTCFFYTYVHNEAVYRGRYDFLPCVDGLMVCEISRDIEHCDCEIGVLPRYNLLDYSLFPPKDANYSVISLSRIPLTPAMPKNFLAVTEACCKAADKCCQTMIQESAESSDQSDLYCPRTWDGWNCFDSIPANSTQNQPCPAYIYKTLHAQTRPNAHYAEKQCMEHGDWFTYTGENTQDNEWTNYARCITVNFNQIFLKFIIGIVSFLVSAIAIIPALVIFSVFRALQIESNKIHKQLLISFLLTAVFYIFNGLFFTVQGAPGEHLAVTNHISCRILFSIQLRYLRLTNYAWMLCEGWYLHRLLVAAFASHDTLISYYFLGWGFPLIPMILYCVLRAVFDDSGCWLGPTVIQPRIEWISYVPCLCCLFINFILMVNIVVILVRKLRCEHSEIRAVHYRGFSSCFMYAIRITK